MISRKLAIGIIGFSLVSAGIGLVAADVFNWFVTDTITINQAGVLLIDGEYQEDLINEPVVLNETKTSCWLNHTVEYIGTAGSYEIRYGWNYTTEGIWLETYYDDVLVDNSSSIELSNDGEHTLNVYLKKQPNLCSGTYEIGFSIYP